MADTRVTLYNSIIFRLIGAGYIRVIFAWIRWVVLVGSVLIKKQRKTEKECRYPIGHYWNPGKTLVPGCTWKEVVLLLYTTRGRLLMHRPLNGSVFGQSFQKLFHHAGHAVLQKYLFAGPASFLQDRVLAWQWACDLVTQELGIKQIFILILINE